MEREEDEEGRRGREGGREDELRKGKGWRVGREEGA